VPAVNSNTTDSAAAGNTDEDEVEAYELPPGQSFRYSLVAVLLIWVAFALSPSSQIIFKKSRSVETLVSNDTPLKLTSYLSEAYAGEVPQDQALPGGQTFHPQWWGDWLKREGPADFRPFVTSNIHLVPPQVWRDYQRVLGLQSGWEGVMDRYNVSTIIVDRQEQPNVYRALNRSQDWSHRYEDEQSAIFVRSGDASASSRSDDSPPDPTDRSTVGEPT
jgi:hypothetical protein